MTAVDDFVINLAGNRFSELAEPIHTDIDLFIDAMLELQAGGGGLPNIPSDTVLGRDSPGVGPVENLTLNATLEFTGAGAIQRAALAGDVTAAAGSNATAIANDAVTFAKMQNIATDRLIGRDTAGTGDPEEISLNATLEFTGAGAIQRAALTGDITAAAGNNATTIANNAVSYAKMQDVSAASRLIGRGSAAGAGDPQEITVSSNLAFSGTDLQGPATASQAQQEAAASSTVMVAPSVQQFHPSAAKCWGIATVSAGTPTLQTSFNVTSITDTATGQLTVTIATDFSTVNYAFLCSGERASTALTVANIRNVEIRNATRAAGTIVLECWDDTAATHLAADPASWHWAGFGDQ
ncbi:MAG: hypothetical protein ACREUY_01210 [Burkholderiales bacterium]